MGVKNRVEAGVPRLIGLTREDGVATLLIFRHVCEYCTADQHKKAKTKLHCAGVLRSQIDIARILPCFETGGRG